MYSLRTFQILLFAYAYDDGPVEIIDLAQGEKLPEKVIDDLKAPATIKMAHNANFEINALSQFYEIWPDQWQCTMIHSLYCGYPASLAGVGKAMGFPQEKQKMAVGKALIRYFCVPCKPTKRNGGRTRNFPEHDIEKWNLFKEYCKQDVEVERAIEDHLKDYPVPTQEWTNWHYDQTINQQGTQLDLALINGALELSDQAALKLGDDIRRVSGIDNPNSVAQLKQWLSEQLGKDIDKLGKEAVNELLEAPQVQANPAVYYVLKKRKEMAKSSVKKYTAMENAVCKDGRVRGLLQFYGANRTGRWAGRLVQVQNLPRNYIPELSLARNLVKQENAAMLELTYGSLPDTISQLIRTAFVPREGYES